MSPRLLAAFATMATATFGQVTGLIVDDQSGDILASAQVDVWRRSSPTSRISYAETDRLGKFRLAGLAADDYQFVFNAEGYVPTVIHDSTRIGSEAKSWTIRLAKRGVVSGLVTDNEARPIGSVKVYPFQKVGDALVISSLGAVTDVNGHYRLFELLPGHYSFSAVAMRSGMQLPAANTGPVFYLAPGGSIHNIDIRASSTQTYSVSGRVVGQSSDEMVAVSIVSSGLSLGTTLTRDGVFTFPHIPSGTYDLLASGPVIGRTLDHVVLRADPWFGRASIVVAGQVEDALLEVRRPAPQSFRLKTKTGSICSASANITVKPIEAWPARVKRTATLHTEAPTLISGLAPGRYSIELDYGASFCQLASPIMVDLRTPPAGQAIPVTLSDGSRISGTVNRKSAGSAAVLLIPTESGLGPVRVAFSDANGSFNLSSVPPGKYMLGARNTFDVNPWHPTPRTTSFAALDLRVGDDVYAELTVFEKNQ